MRAYFFRDDNKNYWLCNTDDIKIRYKPNYGSNMQVHKLDYLSNKNSKKIKLCDL